MLTVTIIGHGNLAVHLIRRIEQLDEVVLHQVYDRKFKNEIIGGIHYVNQWVEIIPADVYIICVSDDNIAEVSSKIPNDNKAIVIHTSGTLDIDVIDANRSGVLYPLQTFKKQTTIDFSQTPIFIEANNPEAEKVIWELARQLSSKVQIMSSNQRQKLHMIAVLSNNFVNAIWGVSEQLCQQYEIDFKLLYPLIQQTVSTIKYQSPRALQTGPAKRNDISTMQQHLVLLDDLQLKEMYQLMSRIIQTQQHEQ